MGEYGMLLLKLKRKAGVQAEDISQDSLLLDSLDDAAEEIRAYLQCEMLPSGIDGYLVRLAALLYQQTLQGRDGDAPGVKTWEYSEGERSQKCTYKTAEEYQSDINSILSRLSRYRRVHVKGGASNETA